MIRARDNPFAMQRAAKLPYQFRADNDSGWTGTIERLKSLNYRAAIVGPHGSGKTTFLEQLGQRLQSRGFQTHSIFLNTEYCHYPTGFIRRVAPSLSGRDIILLDGSEQLSIANWWRFCWHTRRAGGLVITRHSEGRLPSLRVCDTNPALLADLIDQLTGTLQSLPNKDVEELYKKHHGNLRDALRELYDRAAISNGVGIQAVMNICELQGDLSRQPASIIDRSRVTMGAE